MWQQIKKLYYYSWLSIFAQWITCVFFLNIYFKILKNTKIEFVGAKPDPQQNYIVVSNHRSYNDPPLLGYSIHLPVAFIAKKELFKNLFLRIFMLATSTIKVDRGKVESSTFKEARKALKAKAAGLAWSAGIFIEGTRSRDNELGKPNKGPIFLARLARVPIIPMGISYRDNKKTIVVKIGEPYEIDYKGDLEEQSWQCLEKIADLTDYDMPERKLKA